MVKELIFGQIWAIFDENIHVTSWKKFKSSQINFDQLAVCTRHRLIASSTIFLIVGAAVAASFNKSSFSGGGLGKY